MAKHMLTTIDNPFNPFDDFDEWLAYDRREGHYSNELLARVVVTSDELSQADQDAAIESAIDEIIREDPSLIYRKASESNR